MHGWAVALAVGYMCENTAATPFNLESDNAVGGRPRAAAIAGEEMWPGAILPSDIRRGPPPVSSYHGPQVSNASGRDIGSGKLCPPRRPGAAQGPRRRQCGQPQGVPKMHMLPPLWLPGQHVPLEPDPGRRRWPGAPVDAYPQVRCPPYGGLHRGALEQRVEQRLQGPCRRPRPGLRSGAACRVPAARGSDDAGDV